MCLSTEPDCARLVDISVSNEKVAFILRNSLVLLSDVFNEVSESLEREAAELVSSISFLQVRSHSPGDT